MYVCITPLFDIDLDVSDNERSTTPLVLFIELVVVRMLIVIGLLFLTTSTLVVCIRGLTRRWLYQRPHRCCRRSHRNFVVFETRRKKVELENNKIR